MNFYISAAILTFLLYIIIKWSTGHIYQLLCGVSDDIREIKDKLGIDSIVSRTSEQMDNSIQNYISNALIEGGTVKEIRKLLGVWKFYKHKWLIDHYIKDYADKKACPDCNIVFKKDKEKCKECGADLIPIKGRKRRDYSSLLKK